MSFEGRRRPGQNGKGSGTRPCFVDEETLQENWDRALGKGKFNGKSTKEKKNKKK